MSTTKEKIIATIVILTASFAGVKIADFINAKHDDKTPTLKQKNNVSGGPQTIEDYKALPTDEKEKTRRVEITKRPNTTSIFCISADPFKVNPNFTLNCTAEYKNANGDMVDISYTQTWVQDSNLTNDPQYQITDQNGKPFVLPVEMLHGLENN